MCYTLAILSPFPMKFSFPSIIGWTCAILVSALNLFAGVMKYVPVTDPAQLEMMKSMGMTPELAHILGVIEIASTILFLIPRTSTVGFVLLVGYTSGILATLLTHGQDATIIYVVLALLTVSAYFRNPELLSRLKRK